MKKIVICLLLSIVLLFTGCTAEEPGYAVLTTPESVEVTVDSNTGTISTMEYEHHKIHEGSSFCVHGTVDLANGAVRDIQITTPNTTEWAHLLIAFDNESETQYFLYEDVTINVAGAAIVEDNNNRNSAHVSTTTMAVIDNANVANANADTAVAAAVILVEGVSGAGKDGGEHTHGHEWILAQNEDYSLRFVANAAGNVNYTLTWYEHTNN